MVFPALFYIAWDIRFTASGVWSFNEQKIVGIHIFNLPLEEVLFFFIIPYCCVFIYDCIKHYFPTGETVTAKILFRALAALLLILCFFVKGKYSFYTFLFLGSAMLLVELFSMRLKGFQRKRFLIGYLVCLVPFLVVNGLLTAIPVVLYNNNENLNLRIYTIPLEDVFYGMLLVMLNLVIYEWLQHGQLQKPH